MKPLSLYGILLASIACQLVGMLMFAKGFFPYKPISTSFASHNDLPALPLQSGDNTKDNSPPIPPRFGRLVLMLVDALRSDFIYGSESNFTFVQSLIESNKALPFTALASAPTVTLPRLKALTTGTVPGFLDAVLNIAESDQSSTLANQDSWVAQWTRSSSKRDPSRNRTIGFFGDDTWIKLFPGQFFRSDGTSSFFAMDTVEVDVNVTRHVEPELAKEDWDALIFHYLGLDHVGHSGGPKSPLMQPKQAEMDQVALQIYTTILTQDTQHQGKELPTLFILCGDHGMNEVGNHGGSSKSEVSTAFLFASSLFETWGETAIHEMVNPHRQQNQPDDYQYYRTVNQVDLVPTLSLLMGNPIPKNSVGKIIPELFHGYSKRDILRALQVNAHQVAHVLKGMWPSFQTEADLILENWNDSETEDSSHVCDGLKSDREELGCLYSNAIARHASYLEMTTPSSLNIEYKTADQILAYEAAREAYMKFLSNASSMLSTALSKYDMALLTNGSLLIGFAVAGFLYCILQSHIVDNLKASCRSPATQLNTSNPHLSRPRTLKHAIQVLVAMSTETKGIEYGHIRAKQRAKVLDQWTSSEVNWIIPRILTVVILILYLATLFASSFVEEEHQFWYFFAMTWWAALALTSGQYVYDTGSKTRRPSTKAVLLCMAQMGLLRLLRAWNQTGQKYSDEIDIRFYLNSTLKPLSWLLFFLSVGVVAATMVWTVVRRYAQGLEARVQNHKSKYGDAPSAGYKALEFILMSLVTYAIFSVSSWITVYKMDLEASFFGQEYIDHIKGYLWMIRPSTTFLFHENGREMTGFEMARWSYAGLGFILLASFFLAKLDIRRTLSLDEGTDIRQSTFLSVMIQGAFTLLAILLSRRHNAPLFVLFGVQLWLYLQWSKHIRIDCTQVEDADYTLGPLVTEEESSATSPSETKSICKDAPNTSSRYRSLPGLNSIHSTTVILWTMSSFFILGNSNSIASIDIGNAYVGIRSYDIFLTGVLTFVSNWSGPLWWALAGTMLLVTGQDMEHERRWLVHDATLRVAVEEECQWRSVTDWWKPKQAETRRTRRHKINKNKMVRDLRRQQRAIHQKVKSAKPLEEAIINNELNGHVPDEAEEVANEVVSDSTKLTTSIIPCVSVAPEDPMRAERPMDKTPPINQEVEERYGGAPVVDMEAMHIDDAVGHQGEITSRWIVENPSQFRAYLRQKRIVDHLIWTNTFLGLTLYALSIAAIILRHHLFIWTVFSPKVLYQMAWTVLFQTVAQVIFIPVLCIITAL